jgi:ferrous iron transport protein A
MRERTAEPLTAAGTPSRGEGNGRCVSLAELPPGARGRICAHPPAGPVPERLQELGFVPGTSLEVVRQAPFGNPVEFEIRGYRVCLRRADLSAVCVVPADKAD